MYETENQESQLHYNIYNWLQNELPEYCHLSLDEIPLSAFNKKQLKIRNEFLDIYYQI